MLDAYIIDQLKREREAAERQRQQPRIYAPAPEHDPEPPEPEPEPERGIIHIPLRPSPHGHVTCILASDGPTYP